MFVPQGTSVQYYKVTGSLPLYDHDRDIIVLGLKRRDPIPADLPAAGVVPDQLQLGAASWDRRPRAGLPSEKILVLVFPVTLAGSKHQNLGN